MSGKVWVGVLVFLLALTVVSAIGIAQDYHEEHTLFLSPGESYEHVVTVQNPAETPITVRFSVDGPGMSAEEGSLVERRIAAQGETAFVIDIVVPDDAAPGTEYTGRYSVQVLNDQDSTLSVAYRLHDEFTVSVQERRGVAAITGAVTGLGDAMSGSYIIFLLLGVFVLLAVVVQMRSETEDAISVPEDAFRTEQGFATDINQLLMLMDSMSPEAFHDHRENHGNEFANWVYYKTQNRELYEQVRDATTKPEIIRILNEYQQQL